MPYGPMPIAPTPTFSKPEIIGKGHPAKDDGRCAARASESPTYARMRTWNANCPSPIVVS